MGLLSELDNLLEKIPLWKKLKTLPDEVEILKKRIEELENHINSQPGDKCPKCGQMSFSLDRTEDDPMFGDMGVQRDYYKCSRCQHGNFKQRTL